MRDVPSTSPEDAPGARQPRPDARYALAPRTVYMIVATCLVSIALRMWVSEGSLETILLAAFVCAMTGALVVLATRRLLLAVVLMSAQVLLITMASWLKLKYMNMVFHAYDLAFYLTSITTLSFLAQSYSMQVASVALALLLTVVISVLSYRIDPVRVPRSKAAMATVVCAAGVLASAALISERRHSLFEYEGMFLSSFYRSWAETLETLWRGQLLEAALRVDVPRLQPAETCEPREKPPHVILIHHESAVQPSLFPTLDYDRRLDRFFESDDGRLYGLRVETYGGASVLTEFSVMTGISTYAFGGMRLFVQRLMSGKIKETLPQVLSGCGYRNVMFYPMLKSFTSAEGFFKGVGIDEIYDLKAQKSRRVNERDRFYYDNALAEIERHVASSEHPLFAFIETMATHWPYDSIFEPHVQVPGGGPGTHPEMHELLRRLWLSKLDFDHLHSELGRRFPGERFLIVRYGDHHPMSTRVLLGYKDGTEAEDVLMDRKSIGFQTFFAVNGVNFKPAPFWSPPVLDVPYLGTVLLEAAGLPLTDAYRKRQHLKQVCEGQSFDCPGREQVLSFHRQLIDAGLVRAR